MKTSCMDSAQGDSSIEQKEKHGEGSLNEDDEHDLPLLGSKHDREKETSCSSSTSSDDSSDEDFFQLDATHELSKSVGGSSSEMLGDDHGNINAQLASEEFGVQRSETTGMEQSSTHHGVVDLSGLQDLQLAGSQMAVGSPFFADVAGSDTGLFGAWQSPPLQVMGRSDVPDPNRIPSSVFARSKSTTPMEWSVASNESLFSIHVGNSSFSRDHVILLGRSGELGNFYSSSSDGHPPPSPISHLGDSSPVTVDAKHGLAQPSAAEAANAEAMKDVLRAALEEHAAGKDHHPQADGMLSPKSISHHSDGSTTSFRSFAFPILTGEGRSGSIKVEPEPQPKFKQPQRAPFQTQAPKAALGSRGKKWFSCFSCFAPCLH